MNQELKIEKFYNKPYQEFHRKRIGLLNNKQKIILEYMMAGATIFAVGLLIIGVAKLFS